jgi:hypothetical protein
LEFKKILGNNKDKINELIERDVIMILKKTHKRKKSEEC